MISAGEASGDRLGAGLARALRERDPEIQLFGMGGPAMEAAGVRILQSSSDISVVGFAEVIARLPRIRRAMKRLDAALRELRPQLLVPIDAPDFHLRLAKRAVAAEVPVVYFVSPQLWAWRSGRVATIRERVREMLVLFDFETAFYESEGVPVTWVGHPLGAQSVEPGPDEALRASLGIPAGGEVLGLLPGSREGEIFRLLPVLLGAAERLRANRPDLRFLLPVAPAASEARIRGAVSASGVPGVTLASAPFPEMLRVCRAAIVASGTASLEAAVMGVPLVVVYRMNRLSYGIVRRLVRVEYAALPNLIAGRRIVPELLQENCTVQAVTAETERYFTDEAHRAGVVAELERVRRKLGGPGIFERAAERVLAHLPPA